MMRRLVSGGIAAMAVCLALATTAQARLAALHERHARGELKNYVTALEHLSLEDQAKIMGGNAARLLKIRGR